MADETKENRPLSAAPESPETQQVAPQESAVPASPDEGRIRTENRENREGLSQGVSDPEAQLQQGLAAMTQPEGAKAGKPEEEDLGTHKGAMDKISDGMQKAFELIQRFMKQIQAMGSSSLRGMASTLSMLGFKKAAEWLNEMAGGDYAELMSALKKGSLTLAPLNPEDPNAKAQTELSEGAQMLMAEQYKVLAQTRGPAFTREVYYSETVTTWKKQGGNGSKTQLTVEDLQAMAAASKELPATLPGQVAQAQQAQEMFQAIGFDQLPANVSVLNKPFSFPSEAGSAVTAQLVQENGRVQVVVNGQKYGIVAGDPALTDLSTDVRKEASGALLFQNRDGSQVRLEKATLQAIVRSIVAGKGANSLDVQGGEIVGVNVGSQILLSPNRKLSALSLVRIS